MNILDLKTNNKNIPKQIYDIYLLDLYDYIDKYLKGVKNLICIKYNYMLIISDDMFHLNISDTIDNLTNIGKIMSHKDNLITNINDSIPNNLYEYLLKLKSEDIIDMYGQFYNTYIDPTQQNLCQYHHVIDYYLLFEQTMPAVMFNFFNTLLPEDERINKIIKIPNILMYFNMINTYPKSEIINDEVIKKINYRINAEINKKLKEQLDNQDENYNTNNKSLSQLFFNDTLYNKTLDDILLTYENKDTLLCSNNDNFDKIITKIEENNKN